MRKVGVLPQALADMERLMRDDRAIGARARVVLSLLETGEIEGQPLQLMATYGDLRDCRKVYFGRPGDSASHRLVYRSTGGPGHEELEVIAVEERRDGYVYLLASSRLDRLPSEMQRRFMRVHQGAIQRRSLRGK